MRLLVLIANCRQFSLGIGPLTTTRRVSKLEELVLVLFSCHQVTPLCVYNACAMSTSVRKPVPYLSPRHPLQPCASSPFYCHWLCSMTPSTARRSSGQISNRLRPSSMSRATAASSRAILKPSVVSRPRLRTASNGVLPTALSSLN